MLLLLACGLMAMTRHFSEKINTDHSHVADSIGDQNFHATSLPYTQGGRFEPVQY